MVIDTQTPPSSAVANIESVVLAVQLFQPGAGVGDPDAFTQRSGPSGRQAVAVVAYLEQKLRVPGVGSRMVTTPAVALGSMPCLMAFSTRGCSNRVGTAASSVSGRHVTPDGEPVLEADLLDLQKSIEEVQFLVQEVSLDGWCSAG